MTRWAALAAAVMIAAAGCGTGRTATQPPEPTTIPAVALAAQACRSYAQSFLSEAVHEADEAARADPRWTQLATALDETEQPLLAPQVSETVYANCRIATG